MALWTPTVFYTSFFHSTYNSSLQFLSMCLIDCKVPEARCLALFIFVFLALTPRTVTGGHLLQDNIIAQ